MEDGHRRSRRALDEPSGGRRSALREPAPADASAEAPDDVLARHGLLGGAGAPEGGRAARRRAAEQQAQREQAQRRRAPERAAPNGYRPPIDPTADPPATSRRSGGHRTTEDGPTPATSRHAAPPASAGPTSDRPARYAPAPQTTRNGERQELPSAVAPSRRNGHAQPSGHTPTEGRRRREPDEQVDGRPHDAQRPDGRAYPDPAFRGDERVDVRRRPEPVRERPPARDRPDEPHLRRGGAHLDPAFRTEAPANGRRRTAEARPGVEATTRIAAPRPTGDRTRAILPSGSPDGADVTSGPARPLDEPTRQVRRPPVDDDPSDHEESDGERRVRHIDETLTRLTAAHAGLALASDEPDEPLPPRAPVFTPGRILALVVALLVLGGTAFGFGTRNWFGGVVADAGALDLDSSSILDAAAQKGATNVLVVTSEREAVPGATPTSHNAGTFAIAHVPAGGGQLTVVSLPPELEINRPPCDGFDPIGRTYTAKPVPAEVGTQLVSALTVGGPKCVTRVVQQLTGVAITGYVGVDLDGLGALVQTVGGVQVCVANPVDDTELGPILTAPGTQNLDGTKAGDFLRASQVQGEPPTDVGRIERQQGVLASVLTPLLSTTGLLDIGDLGKARPGLGDALMTDGMSLDQVLATARSLRDLDAQGVTVATVPGAPAVNGQGDIELRGADAAALFGALRTDKPLPAGAAGATAATGPKPGDVTVQVMNASDRAGLAAQVGTTLKSLGFGVGDSGNAAQKSQQTVIRFSPDQEGAADLLAASVPSATTVPDPGTTGVLQLVLGRNYDDVLRAPTTAASDPTAVPVNQPQARCP